MFTFVVGRTTKDRSPAFHTTWRASILHLNWWEKAEMYRPSFKVIWVKKVNLMLCILVSLPFQLETHFLFDSNFLVVIQARKVFGMTRSFSIFYFYSNFKGSVIDFQSLESSKHFADSSSNISRETPNSKYIKRGLILHPLSLFIIRKRISAQVRIRLCNSIKLRLRFWVMSDGGRATKKYFYFIHCTCSLFED